MALAVAYLRPPAGGPVPEAIVPEPAFEIFRVRHRRRPAGSSCR